MTRGFRAGPVISDMTFVSSRYRGTGQSMSEHGSGRAGSARSGGSIGSPVSKLFTSQRPIGGLVVASPALPFGFRDDDKPAACADALRTFRTGEPENLRQPGLRFADGPYAAVTGMLTLSHIK